MRFRSLKAFPSIRYFLPSIHHRLRRCVHSIFTPTCSYTFQIAVPPSAYPVAFPQAFASEAIPPYAGLRLTPTLEREPAEGYFVPDFRLTLNLEPHYWPGYFGDATWISGTPVQPDRFRESVCFPASILDQANNPSRLVDIYDHSAVSSSTCPYSTVLDGIAHWV
jgi:hypothetical protein